MASQTGEISQTNVPEHTIVSSILTDLILRRNHERRAILSEPSLNRWRIWDRAKRCKTQNRHNNSSYIILNLDFQKLKTKQLSLIHRTHRSNSFAEKSMNRTASNWNIESPLGRSKLFTNWSNKDMNNTIQVDSTPSLSWESDHERRGTVKKERLVTLACPAEGPSMGLMTWHQATPQRVKPVGQDSDYY